MPLRLPTLPSLRAPSIPSFFRPFSSTTVRARPEDTKPAPAAAPSSPRSSSSSLLSLNRPARHARPRPNKNSAGEAASRLLDRYKGRQMDDTNRINVAHNLARERKLAADYLRQMPRRWEVGDVYAPHDLSPIEMQKWRKRQMPKADVVDILGIRPLDMYKNFSMVSEYTNRTGQILSSQKTGLRPVNQRKMAKMVRRAIGMGIYPSSHGHPEVLRNDFYPDHNQS